MRKSAERPSSPGVNPAGGVECPYGACVRNSNCTRFNSSTCNRSLADFRSYVFGTPLRGAVGSSYALCWGHDPRRPADFPIVVDASGALVGPERADARCTLGLACVVELDGYDLAACPGEQGPSRMRKRVVVLRRDRGKIFEPFFLRGNCHFLISIGGQVKSVFDRVVRLVESS